MTTPNPEVGGAGMSSTAHPGNYGLWHAIHAIVDVHAQYNREPMLRLIEEQRDKHPKPGESASQQEVATMQFEEEESMMGAQIKTTPGAALVTPISPEGLAINELDRSSDD